MAELESAGVDATTGKTLRGWDHVLQSIGKIFSTPHFTRVMRPYVGSMVPALIGRLVNVRHIQRFRWAAAMALLLFEPRFRPSRIDLVELDRTGRTGWVIEGTYFPLGHKGDFSRGEPRRLDLSQYFA